MRGIVPVSFVALGVALGVALDTASAMAADGVAGAASAPIARTAETGGASGTGTPAEAGEASGTLAVESPGRAFGYVLGDVLVQRVPLADAEDGAALAAGMTEGRVGAWFARLPARVARGADGGRRLELRYQVINVPETPRVVALPQAALVGMDGRTRSVAPWPVAIGPLTPTVVGKGGGLPAMRPDRRLPPVDTDARRTRFALVGVALAVTLASWGSWWLWRRRRERVRLPFARAFYEIRSLGARERDESPAAWSALHAALNRTAGRTVGAGSLDALLEGRPWLAPSRSRLEAFFAASTARFFARSAEAAPFPLTALGRELYVAERRHAR